MGSVLGFINFLELWTSSCALMVEENYPFNLSYQPVAQITKLLNKTSAK